MSAHTPEPIPDNFCGLPEGYSNYRDSRAVILPVPLERTTSYMQGTRGGPAAILAASQNMETYDEELHLEPCAEAGIHTLPRVDTDSGTLEEVMERIRAAELGLLNDGKFPVALGGEHSLTGPLVAAALAKYPDLTVLQIDAHADLRDAYLGNPLSHASVMRRVVEMCPAVQVGIRSMCAEEAAVVTSLPTTIFWGKDVAPASLEEWQRRWIPAILGALGKNVYLTVDLDGFDPAYVPATGTPEPGGLDWHQVTALIREVAASRNIVAMDVVELLPQPGDHASDFFAAKLIYKSLGYILCR